LLVNGDTLPWAENNGAVITTQVVHPNTTICVFQVHNTTDLTPDDVLQKRPQQSLHQELKKTMLLVDWFTTTLCQEDAVCNVLPVIVHAVMLSASILATVIKFQFICVTLPDEFTALSPVDGCTGVKLSWEVVIVEACICVAVMVLAAIWLAVIVLAAILSAVINTLCHNVPNAWNWANAGDVEFLATHIINFPVPTAVCGTVVVAKVDVQSWYIYVMADIVQLLPLFIAYEVQSANFISQADQATTALADDENTTSVVQPTKSAVGADGSGIPYIHTEASIIFVLTQGIVLLTTHILAKPKSPNATLSIYWYGITLSLVFFISLTD